MIFPKIMKTQNQRLYEQQKANIKLKIERIMRALDKEMASV